MILILAYGNSLRRDDGAGFVLADVLEKIFFEYHIATKRIDSHQLAPELALEIAREEVASVVFIDTRAITNSSDDLKVNITEVAPPDSASPSMGHSLDARVLLAYTKYLFRKEVPAWLITIPGLDFDHGEGLSETARLAIEGGSEMIGRLAKTISNLSDSV